MLRNLYIIFIISILLSGCSKNDKLTNNNPYLPNYPVDLNINLSLPQYTNLQFPSNVVYIDNGIAGIRGVFVFNTGSGYVAFDAACPNQALTSCSTMTINGIKAVCACDDAEYSFFNGQAAGQQYAMKQYRVQQVNPTTLKVYN